MPEAVLETPPVTPPATAPATVPDTPPAPPATPQATTPPASEPPAADPPPTAPVTYTLALPEKGVLDQSDLDTITAMAKEKGWTNDQAQAAVDEYNASLVAQAATFKAALDAHPEIGGTKFQAAQEHAMRALDRFLPAESLEGAAFRTAMNKSGYGNYAPLMLLLSRIGKAMAEDRPGGTGPAIAPATAVRKSDEEVFFGKKTA